jgi:uncharacterized repeat protein (TIGR03943 family)
MVSGGDVIAKARVIVTVSLSVLLLGYVISNQIYLYIHERSVWLVGLSVPLLLLLAFGSRSIRRQSRGDRWTIGILSLPLLAALVLPARPLGVAALAGQSPTPVPSRASVYLWTLAVPPSPDASPVLDTPRLARLVLYNPALPGLEGRVVSLVGFVYRPPDLAPNQFKLERFVVQCCTADAIAMSILVQHDQASSLTRETWVQVDGHIRYLASAASSTAYVDADGLAVIPQPSRPYVYP